MTTVVTKTVGAVGRDYATMTAWEAATDNNLVAADEIQVGECYDDATFTESAGVTGATVDAGRYRGLVAAAGEEYEPIADVGVVNVWAGLGSPASIVEDFFVAKGIAMVFTNAASAGDPWRFRDYGLAEKCVGVSQITNALSRQVFTDTSGSDNVIFRRCIAIGNAGLGAQKGFFLGSSVNCVAYSFEDAGASGRGFQQQALARNCVAVDTASFDYSLVATEDHCASEDGTAAGTGSLANQAMARLFRDVLNHDFRPMRHSPHIEAGTFVVPRKPFAFEQALTLTPVRLSSLIDLGRDLVLALPFNIGSGTALADLSGKGNNATLDPTGETWVRELPGTVLDFDATDTVPIVVTQTADLPLYQHSAFSLAIWLAADATAGKDYWLWSEENTPAWYALRYHQPSGNKFQIFHRDDLAVTQNPAFPGGATFTDGEWTHVAIVDQEGAVALYVNGQFVGSVNYTRGTLSGLGTQPFGDGSGATRFDGRCADIRAWKRALTAAEVLRLYEHPWEQYGVPDETDFAGVTVPTGAARSMGAYEEAPLPAQPKNEFLPLTLRNLRLGTE